MKNHCISIAELETIHQEMQNMYGCTDNVGSMYAHIINLLIAGYFDEGMDLFLQEYRIVPLQNDKLNLYLTRFYSQTMLKQHKYTNVIARLNEIVYLYESSELYNNYAIALYKVGQVDQAIKVLHKAILISPEPVIKSNLEKILNAI